MIFPTLKRQRIGYINFDLAAQEWHKEHPLPEGAPNPFLDTAVHAKLVYDFHERTGIDYSYGGWLEERTTILAGTYLEKEHIFMHLGVDLNPPEGTPVAVSYGATVTDIDDDHPLEGGWGPRVIVKLHHVPIHLIYAHLDPRIPVTVGEELAPGGVLGAIGPTSHNGGWFPHLHIQSMTEEAYALHQKNPDAIDGYAKRSDIERVSRLYPDPLQFITFA